MKRLLIFVPVFLLALATLCQAQNREKYVISAKAGGINTVSGQVDVRRQGEKDWQTLTAKDDLASGDVVRTGTGGIVEVLLNPGTYLRLPGNSEFELTDASLDNLKVRLAQGSAILEATGVDGADILITFITPQTRIAVVRKGVYRFNVTPGAQTEVIVRNGRALVGAEELKLKGGNKAIVRSGATNVEVAKYEKKKEQDQFDLWSKERAETLAQANSKLSDRAVNSFFSGYTANDWANLYDAGRYGIWFYNAKLHCFTFLPFSLGWASPYGHSYGTSIYSPWSIYYPGYYRGRWPQPVTTGPGLPGGGSPGAGGVPSGSGGGGLTPVRITPTPMPSRGQPSNGPSRKGTPGDIDG